MYLHVKRGYHWCWLDSPPRLNEPRLEMQNLEVQVQVQALLDLGAIYEVQSQPCFLTLSKGERLTMANPFASDEILARADKA